MSAPGRVVVTGVGIVSGTLVGGWDTLSAFLEAAAAGAHADVREPHAAVREPHAAVREPHAAVREPHAAVREVSAEALGGLVDGNEQRRLSRVSQLTVAATRLALADAGVEPGGDLGLVLGTEFGDLRSTMEFADGYLDRGPAGLSPLLFPSTVMNTMVAASSIAVSARGAAITLNAPAVAGQLALARAAQRVTSGRIERVVAGGVDELERFRSARLRDLGVSDDVTNEGATLLVLESAESAAARGARVLAEIRGAAWGAMPARPQGVGRRAASSVPAAAVRAAGLDPREIGWIYTSVSRDPERARWERAVLERAFAGARPLACDLGALLGHGSGAGAMRVAAAAWTSREGRLPHGGGEAVGPGPGLVHGLARGGTQVALVVDRAGAA